MLSVYPKYPMLPEAIRRCPTLSRLYPTLSDAIRRPGRRLDAFWRVTIAIRWLSDGDPLWLSNDYIRQLSNGPGCAIGPIVSCSDSAQWKSYTKMYQNVTVNPNPVRAGIDIWRGGFNESDLLRQKTKNTQEKLTGFIYNQYMKWKRLPWGGGGSLR